MCTKVAQVEEKRSRKFDSAKDLKMEREEGLCMRYTQSKLFEYKKVTLKLKNTKSQVNMPKISFSARRNKIK